MNTLTVASASSPVVMVTGSNTAAGSVGSSDSGHTVPSGVGVPIGVASSELVPLMTGRNLLPLAATSAVGRTLVSSGSATGLFMSWALGDHSVTAMSVPGETPCTMTNNSDGADGFNTMCGLNGTLVTLNSNPPGPDPGVIYDTSGAITGWPVNHHRSSPSASGSTTPAPMYSNYSCTGCGRAVTCEDEWVVEVTGANAPGSKSSVPVGGVPSVGAVGLAKVYADALAMFD